MGSHIIGREPKNIPKYAVLFGLIIAGLLFSVPILAHSQSPTGVKAEAAKHALALIAPEGRWVTRLEIRGNGYSNWQNSAGQLEPLGKSFDSVVLDASIFPALAALGSAANLGTTQLSTDVSIRRLEWTLGYGLTENLTVGAIINYGETRSSVDFSVKGGNVGFNPAFNPALPIGATNFPFAPVGLGASQPVGTSGVNEILTNPLFGFGYDAFKGEKTHQYGSLLAGFLWRLYQSDHDSWVLGAGYRKGLADELDPNKIFQIPLDDGSDDGVLQLEYFRGLLKNGDIRLMAKRTFQFEDKATRRVPLPGQSLATQASIERLTRDLGDFWEYDLEVGHIIGSWRGSVTWHRYQKSGDHYTSARGQNVSALEMESSQSANQWRIAASWSGVDAWLKKEIPLPLIVKLEYQTTYSGHNMPDVDDIYLTLTTFF